MTNPLTNDIYVCGYDLVGSRGQLGLDPSGNIFLEYPWNTDRLDLCPFYQPTKNIDNNGVVYGLKIASNTEHIAAYQNSTVLWETPITSPCLSNNPYSTSAPFVGPQGELYILHDHYCSGRKVYLTQFNSTTGDPLFTRLISNNVIANDPLRQFDNGFIYKDHLGSNATFTYHSYSNDAPSSTFTPNLSTNEHFGNQWQVDPSGNLALSVAGKSSICDERNVTKRIIYKNEQELSYDIENECIAAYTQLRMSPDAIILTGSYPTLSTNPVPENSTKLVIINSEGMQVIDLQDPDAYRLRSPNELETDLQGNILIGRPYEIRENFTTYTHQEFILYSPEGDLLKRFTTETYQKNESYRLEDTALTNGFLHVLFKEYRHNNSYFVDKVPFALIDVDYSRGTLMNIPPHNIKPLKYAAMGDSFSSGEGVEPFIEGTADEGLNECHRSGLAYSKLLSADPSLPLIMPDEQFLACSGAVTENITSISQYGNEPPQIDRLNRDTDVVTLTIGGNDVGFATYARNCVLSSCEESTSHYDTIMNKIDNELYGKLVNTYEQISDELDKENARVVISGYPYVFPLRPISYPLTCMYATAEEQDAAFVVTNSLNNKIKAAVEYIQNNVDDRFEYLDINTLDSPFRDRQLCWPDTYFIGVINGNVERYTFHPNKEGQAAFAESFRRHLLHQ